MYDASRCFIAYVVHYDYDICLLMLLKCIAIYDLDKIEEIGHKMTYRWRFRVTKFDSRTFCLNFYELYYFFYFYLLSELYNK